ncbi:tetratricopeptide repeat-containing glycosyltransferase family 2 protein [Clostridium thermarum]|uniref:tetratricopeptide repeat-containing glycosyltransferase family 2 protein n=1 Tax=Clostridium thermarum TaxID=1716543 RepID=UPI00111CF9CF|nr:TPR domain-containing glycosyltransferase [Clostridium thermarum]
MSNEISLCMIVKNEENNLARCLNSITDLVDEIIIVDTGSTDRTVEIAKSFGAKVYHYQWTNSFSAARNESLKYATKDWILILDADDEFCSEDKDLFKELVNKSLDENNLYFFETLNYCGSFPDINNISINLNPRLFKNNFDYTYAGTVHNQLINTKNKIKDVKYPIRIYHYGYLDTTIKEKDKRKRNISLLEDQLKEDPNNKYAHFNIGNEYFALGNMSKALEHYYKSYEDFNPSVGYGFILIIRILLANHNIGQYDRALQFADIGLKYYPRFTDLYFFKAIIYTGLRRYTLAIKALKKCLELGEAPAELKFLYGTGTFKAAYELGNIYLKLKDYATAFEYFVKAIKFNPNFIAALNPIAHILKEENTPMDSFKKVLESFFNNNSASDAAIANLFYAEGCYDTALEYIRKCEDAGYTPEDIRFLKTKALAKALLHEDCINNNTIKEDSNLYVHNSMYRLLSLLITEKYDKAIDLINSFDNNALSTNDKWMLLVYTQLVNLYMKKPAQILSEDENEKQYTPIIFEILEILLINKRFDEFEMALELLNLISDKSVLLHLGKLYNKHGFKAMAKKEIIRSIKEFDIYDWDGLEILIQ